jgi:RES domain-containing protein
MVTVWRLVKTKRVATAFDGEGAKLSGGRWNSPGVGVVYTADSPSTAALEILAQDYPPRAFALHWSLLTATVPDELVERVDVATLPAEWAATPWPPALPALGDRWVAERRSLVLAVPSAVVPWQRNYVINPDHPARPALKISGPERFAFDARILEKMLRPSAP